MATLALAAAGAAVGSAVLPAGMSVLGVTISGATIGSQIGALAGAYVDQALFGASGETRTVEGPRLQHLHVTSSTEGAAIPRIYGRVRLGGQVIWATDFEEEVRTTTETSGGGKGVSSGGGGIERVEYRYYANFAVAICEGEISGLRRVWADGAEIDLSRYVTRFYRGSETQPVDSLISAREGRDQAPAYRGTAYVVFERLPLARFGNRLPQLSFEVYRSVEPFAEEIRGVVLIPGSGEFVYAPEPVVRTFGYGGTRAENVHTLQGASDWQVALDQLEDELPNAKNVSLIVSWFGTDLRAGHCAIRPGVDIAEKTTEPFTWRAGGAMRAQAHLISTHDSAAAYGGTPADRTVVDAIRDLKQRGIGVTLTPFLLMDVPDGNALANPYGGASQPAYPWRGRITCHPAPGQPGSPDKTATAATQIAAFVGTAEAADFDISGRTVSYSGPSEWSYRRMVLHLAHLAKAGGGVDTFVIGTELRGLTWVRDGEGSYPFVAALCALADDVKAVLGAGCKITYAADWSEYFGHQPQDGSGDVCFHLDPLWASESIDAIGIDCYWPLADWRDGREHLDYVGGHRSIYDLAYLRSNLVGGEGFDWYYASPTDRDVQARTPITDGAGKPWVFRYKDVRSWWINAHFNRPGGVEDVAATEWVPQSKPIWFMEIGCPAADKGANQPNVFVDPKSSETALPYYSNGARDDLMQRCYIRAFVSGFDPDADGYVAGLNPVSEVYGGRMVDCERIYAYCWDARPYPAFPQNLEAWGDGANWRRGQWLSGRLASVPLSELVEAILRDFDFDRFEAESLQGMVPGYIVDRAMSARDALQPLGLAYFFDAVESQGAIAFRHRGASGLAADFVEADLVEGDPDTPLATVVRGQETDLPASAKLNYISSLSDYQQAVVDARRLVGASGRLGRADLPIVLEADQATRIAESWLFETWASRERASFILPPSQIGLEPGDVVRLTRLGNEQLFRITEIGDHGAREIEARSIDPDIYVGGSAPHREASGVGPIDVGRPKVELLDLPLLTSDEDTHAACGAYFAALKSPWPGAIALYGSPEEAGYRLRSTAAAPAILGETIESLPPGPIARIDHANRLQVSVSGGELYSVSRLQLLAGANAAAVRTGAGDWEILQFEMAELIGSGTYLLSDLLRGQAGSEGAMQAGEPIAAGAPFVMLNGAIARVDLSPEELGLPYFWRYGPANRDLADASYDQQQYAFRGIGLRPYAPVHLRGRRAGGELEVTWVRRTRVGGDSWGTSVVPLAEEFERYEIDILRPDGSVARTLTSDTSSVTYTISAQMEDFGGAQEQVRVRIAQLSAVFGRGASATAVL